MVASRGADHGFSACKLVSRHTSALAACLSRPWRECVAGAPTHKNTRTACARSRGRRSIPLAVNASASRQAAPNVRARRQGPRRMPRAKPVRQVHRFVQRRESRARRVLSRGEGGPAKSQFRKVASFGAAASRGAAGRRLAARVGANVCPIAGSMCCHGGAPRPPACPAPPGATAGLREDHPSRGSTRDLALKLARARHGASGAPPRREGACLRSGPETQLGGHVENGGLSTLDGYSGSFILGCAAMSYPVESQNAAMPPRRSVAAINASVEAPKEVADACETTIRDEFQHVAIRPNGVEMDGKHMDNGKSIPLEGAAAALRRTPARTRSRTQEEGGGGMGAHTPCRARARCRSAARFIRAQTLRCWVTSGRASRRSCAARGTRSRARSTR